MYGPRKQGDADSRGDVFASGGNDRALRITDSRVQGGGVVSLSLSLKHSLTRALTHSLTHSQTHTHSLLRITFVVHPAPGGGIDRVCV